MDKSNSKHPPLVYLKMNSVSLFDISLKNWTRTPLSCTLPVDDGSRYVWGELGLLCSGGASHSGWEELGTQVFLLTMDWEVLSLPNMQVGRGTHGLWYRGATSTLLTFGGLASSGENSDIYIGFSPTLASCEILAIEFAEYQQLSDMREARSYVALSQYGSVLYICGQGSYQLEVFDPDANSFLNISIELPEAEPSFLFVDNGHLVVLSQKYLVRYQRKEDDSLEQLSLTQHRDLSLSSNMQPVVDSVNARVLVVAFDSCYSIQVDGSESTLAYA